jgi:hypothetical protein
MGRWNKSDPIGALEWELHRARAALTYQEKTGRPERDGSRAEQIANARARVQQAQKAYEEAKPIPVSLSPRSIYFIGPRRKQGTRGDGPTIICFHCKQEKPNEEFYKKGTVCKACVKLKCVGWAKKHPEIVKQTKINWELRNKSAAQESKRKYRLANLDKEKERARKYNANNREKKNAWTREYLRRKKKTDPKWRALMTCKRRMWILFKSAGVKKNTRSSELMGIDRNGFYAHIESLWLPGMTWENRGRDRGCWHIDHKRPCASFDMTDPTQAKACWHYTNLQPLWAEDNWAKNDRWEPDCISTLTVNQ